MNDRFAISICFGVTRGIAVGVPTFKKNNNSIKFNDKKTFKTPITN